jgi:hypothetical protein
MTEIHVVPFFGNWAIKMTGKESPLSTHNRKDEAVKIATRLSKKHNTKLVIMDNPGNSSK